MNDYVTPKLTDEQRGLFEGLLMFADTKNLSLISCLFDDEPAAVICGVREDGDDFVVYPYAILLAPEWIDRLRDPSGRLPKVLL